MPASGPAAGPLLSLTPKQLPPGSDPVQVRLRWSTGGERVGSVFVAIDGGEESLVARGTDGDEKLDWIEEGAYEFRLYVGRRPEAARTARVRRKDVGEANPIDEFSLEDASWQDAVRAVNFLSLSGDFAKADEILAKGRDRFAGLPSAAPWLAYAKAKLDARAGRLEDARASISEALDHPLPPAARSTLRLQLAGLLAAAGDRKRLRAVLTDLFQDPFAELPDVVKARSLARTAGLRDIEATDRGAAEIPRVFAEPIAALDRHVLEVPSLGRRVAPPTGVFVLGDVTAVRVNRGLFLFDSEGRLIENCSHAGSPAMLAEAARLAKTKAARIAQPAALIQDYFVGENYCHWLLDWLPRIAIARMAGVPIERIVGFSLAARFQRETLSACGFGENAFVSTKDAGALRFRRLVVSESSFGVFRHPAQCGHPVLVRWLRDLGRLSARRSSSARRLASDLPSSPRLYLCRRGVGAKRALTNEDAVIGLLERYGFGVFDPAAHSFAEQAGALGVAEAVVGVHGAALTNTVFSPPGCHVLELRSPSVGSLTYAVVASAVGLDYEALEGQASSGSEAFPLNDSPITVDLDQVEQWLRSRFGPPRRARRP